MEFRAVVTDIRQEQRIGGVLRWQLQLDPTEFRVGETGSVRAVSRSGATLDVQVLGVAQDTGGEIWHVVEKPLAAGTAVTAQVDRL